MGIFQDRLSRDVSRLELAIVLGLLLLIGYIVMGRAEAIFAHIERMQMNATLQRLRTSLQLDLAARIMRGDADLMALNGANPFDLQAHTAEKSVTPVSEKLSRNSAYLGVLFNPDIHAQPSGHWYFDGTQFLLVYLVSHDSDFRSPLSGPARVRFRVELNYEDLDGDGIFRAGTDKVADVRLREVEQYFW